MHEKTLLYSALGVTALGAAIAVYRQQGSVPVTAHVDPSIITPVTIVDSSGTLAEGSPIQLTASDGSGIRLVSMVANAVVEDPLALTELHLVFENPENRVREGTFRITLPQGASVSRFAMKVNETWQEGEVVEKQAARRAYEDFLHRKQDPALLEQGGGNEFTARVFPIPARGRKELVLTYAEVLAASAPYTLPLKGLPTLWNLDIDVQADATGARSTSFGIHKQQFAPGADFVVAAKDLPRSPGLRSGELAVVRVVPFATSRPDPVGSVLVMVDSSASRALGQHDQIDLLSGVLATLGDVPVRLATFDQEVTPIYTGNAAGFGQKPLEAVLARGALGASNIERALDWAAVEAKKAGAKRVLFVTDGVATAGETDPQKLRAKIEPLRAAGVERIDAIAVGGIRDDGLLRTLVHGVLDRDGVVLDAKLGALTIARRLGEATSSGVPVSIPGATWSWPTSLDGMQSGDEVVVFAKMKSANEPVKLSIGQQAMSPDVRAIDRPLVERAVAQAEIQSLVESPTKDSATTKREIVELSTKHRVLSPYTALLVLETDQDYARFNIDRNAKIDILAVRGGRIAVVESGRRPAPTPVIEAEEKKTASASQRRGEEGPMAGAAASPPAAAPGAGAPAAPREITATGAADLPTRDPGAPAAGESTGASANAVAAPAVAPQPAEPSAPPPPQVARAAAAAPARRPSSDDAPSDDLRIGGGGSPVQGGSAGRGLAGIGGGSAGAIANDRAAGASAGGARLQGAAGVVQVGPATFTGGSVADADRVLAGNRPRFRSCYQTGLNSDPTMAGRVLLEVTVAKNGEVVGAAVVNNSGLSPATAACAAGVVRRSTFSAPGTDVKLRVPLTFAQQGDSLSNNGAYDLPGKVPPSRPYDGPTKVVMDLLAAKDPKGALVEARKWQAKASGDVMALVALGEALEATSDEHEAARAYGSILELFASRADSRRFAGERLERLKGPFALDLASDTYEKAVEQRPDHPASHRLYAFALVKAGHYEKAFQAIVAGSKRSYPPGRFAGVDRILKEDVGLVAAAWMKAEPKRAAEIARLRDDAGGTDESNPSLRFVLVWETDANDVDFHIYDGKGGHAYYGNRELPSGGSLYADVTTGYGPECFTIRGARESRAYPYTLQAHYYSRGPMGYGMGKLQIIEHDGRGGLTFDERPFVVMVDRAFVDLGTVERSKR
jgi:hypothetical protein